MIGYLGLQAPQILQEGKREERERRGEERRGEERRGEGEGEEVTQCNLRLLYDSQSARNGLATFTESTHEN